MAPSAASPRSFDRTAIDQLRLQQMVALLERMVTAPGGLEPCLIAVADADGPDGPESRGVEGEVSFMPLAGDPYELLATVAFRPGTWAVGIVADGWAAGASSPAARPSQAPDRIRSHTILLVAASGASAACTLLDDGRRIEESPTGPLIGAVRAARRAGRPAVDWGEPAWAGRTVDQSRVTTTLPLALRSASSRIASPARSSG